MNRIFKFFAAWLAVLTLVPAAIAADETTACWATPLANDPIKAQIYRLPNGLTVCLSVNKETPNLYTYIGVRTGSMNDPLDKTGLAHYLEHLLFKGSNDLGTIDYAMEKPLLDQIDALYDRHEATADPAEREAIYTEIDQLSGEAARFIIQSEFDQALNQMGATEINAYTSLDRTVYLTSLPGNQLEKFLKLQYDRFRSPVFRGFHTELETVFEEFNMAADRPGSRFYSLIADKLYAGHPYARPVIGLPEHLKNPSPRRVMEFYRQWYVPNNMVIVLAGDFNPEQALKWIEETFGQLEAKPLPDRIIPMPPPIRGETVTTLTAPDYEMCVLAWRIDRPDQHQLDLLSMINQILSNGSAGLLDQDITIPQKAAGAFASADGKPGLFGTLMVGAVPNSDMTPEAVKTLLDAELTKLKNGDFPDWLPEAIVKHMRLKLIQAERNNQFRADWLLGAFLDNISWPDAVAEIDRLGQLTKADIVAFAQQHLNDDRLVFYRTAGPLPPMEKLAKPPLTPLAFQPHQPSRFFLELLNMSVEEIKPEFPDLVNGIVRSELEFSGQIPYQDTELTVKRHVPVQSVANVDNDFFTLHYVFAVGSDNDRRWPLAAAYSDVAGTERLSDEELKIELYKLAGSISLDAGREKVTLTVSGLQENFDAILALVKEKLTTPRINQTALQLLVQNILLERKVATEKPQQILFDGMMNYAKYGPNYSKESELSAAELQAMPAETLTGMLQELAGYPVRILYYGPEADSQTNDKLDALLAAAFPLPLPEKRPPVPVEWPELATSQRQVYFFPLPNLRQVHMLFMSRCRPYNPDDIGTRQLFNQYYGSGMSSVTFQKLREENSLCYSCVSSYSTPATPRRRHYFFTYLTTQADKLPEAIKAVEALGFPMNLTALEHARNTLLKAQAAERWQDEALLELAETYRQMGLPPDYRQETYQQLQEVSAPELDEFYRQEIGSVPNVLLIVGDENIVDLKALEAFGPVKKLSVEDIFPQ